MLEDCNVLHVFHCNGIMIYLGGTRVWTVLLDAVNYRNLSSVYPDSISKNRLCAMIETLSLNLLLATFSSHPVVESTMGKEERFVEPRV